MAYLGHSPTNAGSFIEIDDFGSSFNGSTTAFNMQVGGVDVTPSTANVLCMIDGVVQMSGSAYTISGSTITFTEAPPSGADLYLLLMGQSASVGHGTIGADELNVSGDGSSGQFLASDGDGTFTWTTDTENYLPLAGGTMTGAINLGSQNVTNGGTITGTFVGNITGNVTGNTSGTAATVTGGTQASITSAANLVTVGTIGTGVWQGTPITSAYLNASQTAITSLGDLTSLTVNGNITLDKDGQAVLKVESNDDAAELQLRSFYSGSARQWSIFSNNSADELMISDGTTRFQLNDTGGIFAGTVISNKHMAVGAETAISNWEDTSNEWGALHLGNGGSVFGAGSATTNSQAYIATNVYYNGGWKRIGAGEASFINLNDDGHIFFQHAAADAGTAGADGAITFSQSLKLDVDKTATFGGNILRTASGDTTITCHSTSGGDPSFVLNSDAANRSGFLHFKDQDNQTGYIKYSHSDDSMNFHTANSGNPSVAIIGDNSITGGKFAVNSPDKWYNDDYVMHVYGQNGNGDGAIALGDFGHHNNTKSTWGTLLNQTSNGFNIECRRGGEQIHFLCSGGKRFEFFPSGDMHITSEGYTATNIGFDPSLVLSGDNPSMGMRVQAARNPKFYNIVLGNNGSTVHFFPNSSEVSGAVCKWATSANDGGSSQADLMTLNQSGALTLASTLTENSDERLKKNVKELEPCLDKINSLKPVTYKWKAGTPQYDVNGDSVTETGLTAQDVEKYFPEMVEDSSTMDTEDIKYKSLKYTRMITPMIKAIQELTARLEALESA